MLRKTISQTKTITLWFSTLKLEAANQVHSGDRKGTERGTEKNYRGRGTETEKPTNCLKKHLYSARTLQMKPRCTKLVQREFVTRPYCAFCAFCALYADSAIRTLPLFFFCFFIFFDRSDKILTCLNTCLCNPRTFRQKIVRLSSAQFSRVMVF